MLLFVGMGHFLAVALSFPAVVYTVLLGVSLVYWVFVMAGAIHLDADGAADAAADAALDGVAKGALEGGMKGILEGAADHAGHAGGGDVGDVGDVGDADLDGDVGDGHGGAQGIMAALKLRSAPATVVLSLIILWAWIFAILAVQGIEELLPAESTATTLARVAVVVLAPVLALFPTSVLVRPLAKIFTPHQAARSESLVGKICTIRTGTVTDRFGEAFVEDGGAGVVVRVRVDGSEKLGRGDQALLVGYDEARGEFTVAPMAGLLDERPPPEEAAEPDEAARLRRV